MRTQPRWWGLWREAATAVLAVLVTLKVTEQIGWSWWWVMSPVWVSAIVGVVVGVATFRRTGG